MGKNYYFLQNFIKALLLGNALGILGGWFLKQGLL